MMNGGLEKKDDSPLCFVVGPIGKDGTSERKHADLLLNAVIKTALQTAELKYRVKRADEDADPGMIGDRVISDIINAELVVADLTDLNPNAFYELGIRHSTEKPTIHIAKTGTILPFDNVSHRTIFVDLADWHSTQQARVRLTESARAVTANDYRVSNPITQANASFRMRQSEDPKDRLVVELQERLASIEGMLSPREATTANTPSELLNNYGLHARSLWNRHRPTEDILRMLKNRAVKNSHNIEPIKITPENLLILNINGELYGFQLGERRTA